MKTGNPGGGDKICPCIQFVPAYRDNFVDLGMLNKKKRRISPRYVFAVLP